MKLYFLLSAVVLALSACVKEQYEGADLAGGKLVVTGGINQIESRVTGTSWESNDEIGVSCASANHENILYFTSDGTPNFATEAPVYVLGGGTYTYTAYYPYLETVSASNPEISFTTPQDFMWASADVTRENPNATFQFQHKMSKISITISGNGGEGTGKIHLQNVYTDGKFNTLTGEVTSPSTLGTLTSDFTFGTPTAFILTPVQNLTEKISVLVEYNGKAYGGEILLTSLDVNTEYQYTIDVSTTEPGEQLSISSPTIADWGNKVDNGSIAVTEEKLPNVLEIGDFLLADGNVIDKDDPDFESMKSNVRGVVYYVGNPQPSVLYGYNASMDILAFEYPTCTNGLAIAINNANNGTADRFATAKYDFSAWYEDQNNTSTSEKYIGTNLNLTSIGERMLGYNNTRFVKAASETINDDAQTGVSATLAIIDGFNTSNTVTKASTWYIPSYAEFKAVIDNYDTVNASVVKAGGALLQYNDFGTTNNETFYWTSDLRGSSYTWGSPMLVPGGDIALYLTRNSNGIKGFFRLSIAF